MTLTTTAEWALPPVGLWPFPELVSAAYFDAHGRLHFEFVHGAAKNPESDTGKMGE